MAAVYGEGVKLFVGGIPESYATQESLSDLIWQNAGVSPLEVAVLPPKGRVADTRCAFVRVPPESVEPLCQALDGIQFEGMANPLVVRRADDAGKGGKGFFPPVANGKGKAKGSMVPPAIGYYSPPVGQHGKGGGSKSAYSSPSKGPPPPSFSDSNGSACSSSLPEWAASDPQVMELSTMMEQAKADGRWMEAAEWEDQQFSSIGESDEDKFQRLALKLKQAAAMNMFYEATSILEYLTSIDAERAAAANTAACNEAKAKRKLGPTGAQTRIPSIAHGQPSSKIALPHQAKGYAPGGKGVAAHSVQAGQRYQGVIISFNPVKHFGFIQSAEFGTDAFLSEKQIGTFEAGSAVSFEVTYNHNGQPQAQNLQVGDGDNDGASNASGNAFDNPAKRLKYV